MSQIPSSYKESKARFHTLLPLFQNKWPTCSMRKVTIVEKTAHANRTNGTDKERQITEKLVSTIKKLEEIKQEHDEDEFLTMDILFADAIAERQHLLMFITGVHGVEGYLGSALLQQFATKQMPSINPQTTGICLIHAVNPWGMQQLQRNNEHNVDLNRNFVLDREVMLDNPAYEEFQKFLQPTGPASVSVGEIARFLYDTGKHLFRHGSGKLKRATMTGQFLHPDGIYYGGIAPEPSAQALIAEFERLFSLGYQAHLILDLHTGYGKKNRMTCVNSPFDGRDAMIMRETLQYDLVTQTAADDFYPIHGDLIDFIYKKYPIYTTNPDFFATCLEFGTGGEGMIHMLKSLWLTIAMNRLNQYGAVNEHDAAVIRSGFQKLFLPVDPSWERMALIDFDRAMKGLLRMTGITE